MWLALTLISFIGFLTLLFTLTRLGFDERAKPRKAAIPLALGALGCAVLWAWSLARVPPPYPLENTNRFEAPR